MPLLESCMIKVFHTAVTMPFSSVYRTQISTLNKGVVFNTSSSLTSNT